MTIALIILGVIAVSFLVVASARVMARGKDADFMEYRRKR